MKPIYRRLLILAAAIVILIGGYVAYRYIAASRNALPQEFSEARTQGALISEKIVENSNEVAFAISNLNDGTTSRAETAAAMGEITNKVAEVRNQAVALATELGKMAESLPEIRSEEAKEAALESVSQRLKVIENLITYTDKVTRLTSLLQRQLQQGAKNSAEIQRLVAEINTDAGVINDLNRSANESMERFDSLLR